MNPHSEALLRRTFETWRVQDEYADTMYHYLTLGYNPGGFFTAVLANDCLSAFQRSHPANKMQDLKNLAGWIRDHVPEPARGSYEAVNAWCDLTQDERYAILEENGLKHSPQHETWRTLNEPDPEMPAAL